MNRGEVYVGNKRQPLSRSPWKVDGVFDSKMAPLLSRRDAQSSRIWSAVLKGGEMRSEPCNRCLGLAFVVALIATGAGRLSGAMLQSARDNASVAFVHVTVVDGTGAAARSDQTVVTSGDRIRAVGPSSTVRIPRGAHLIDSTGRFVIPGLWDAHIHPRYEGIDHFRLLIANGITSARNMSAPWDYLSETRRDACRHRKGCAAMDWSPNTLISVDCGRSALRHF
jgi:hypothetical protein